MYMEQESGRPRYRELEQFIREKITNGTWGPGHQLPTERELLGMFGVSRITTTRALLELQKSGLVTREQGRGTFVNHPPETASIQAKAEPGAAAPTSFTGLRVIAMVLPDTAVDSGFKMIEGAERWLRQKQYRLLSSVSDFNLEREAELIRSLWHDGVAKLILYPIDSEATARAVEEVSRLGMKVVIIDRRLNNVPMPFVGSDNFGAGHAITKHLIKAGHRLIAFASGDVGLISSVADRFRGYYTALAEAKLPVDPGLIVNAGQLGWGSHDAAAKEVADERDHGQYEQVAERTLDYLFELHSDRPSAVVAANDRTALMLLQAALRRGVRVPEELAVVGFDNLARSAMAEVPLTTVQQQFKLMGREAAKLILEDTLEVPGNVREVLLPTEVVIRRSCGLKELVEAR